MAEIKVIASQALGSIPDDLSDDLDRELTSAWFTLKNHKGAGNELLGWLDLPSTINNTVIDETERVAELLRKKSEIVVVTGIGGSYLGARAVIDALSHHFHEWLPGKKYPQIIYAGHQLSSDYHSDLLGILEHHDYSVIVISKSGTTTEPAIAYRLLRNHLEKKYGYKEAISRTVAITDKSKGALRMLADKEGITTFEIPDDIGGRYSVLTPVGLLPIAVSGIDIRKLLKGASDMRKRCMEDPGNGTNPAALYAKARQALYHIGKPIEIMVGYEPGLHTFSEWWKQLYGESEGKGGKGIFPTSVNNTTDLHSMGQYIQDGLRVIFETVISFIKTRRDCIIPKDYQNYDNLNWLAGKSMLEVNQKAEEGTREAHIEGGVPNIRIEVPELSPYYIGQLIYMFEFACGISAYMMKVNPFDQPGVEAYKANMFRLLGKR